MTRVRAMLVLRVCWFGSYGSSTFGVRSLESFSPFAPRAPDPHTWPLGHCEPNNEPFRYTLPRRSA